MKTQTAHPDKLVIFLCLLVSLALLQKADAASITEDISKLAETAKSTADSFLQESFDLRLKYLYNGCQLNEHDRQNLYNLTLKASGELRTIAKIQQSLKDKIENYQGTDWDEKYGKTGLWRKLAYDIHITALYNCSADFYRALAAEPGEKNKILRDTLAAMDPLDKAVNLPDVKLLKAKINAQLARTELAYKPSAIYQLNALASDRDIPEPIRFRATIEKIGFLGSTESNNSDELLKKLDAGSCRDDLELVLMLAFLQQQKDPAAFEKIVQKWPQAQDHLAPLILDTVLIELINEQDITRINTFDAELAVLAAWKNNAQRYTQLLDKFASVKKFQTPLVLYVAGLAFTETAPAKSINFLTQASKLQRLHASSRLDISPEKIAEQAAKLAYNLFLSDASACPVAVEAFQNYSTIAADKADIQLEYLHTLVLNQCGQSQQAIALLKKITAGSDAGPAEIWHKRATFDLILQTLSQNAAQDAARNSAIEQLAGLIDDCPADSGEFAQLRTEAVTIYCQLLLENKDTASAQKILDILRYSQPNQPILTLLKSKALLQQDKLCESAQTLLEINDPNYTGFYNHAMELLEQTVEKIDLLEAQEKNFQQIIQTCEKLAHLCYTRLHDAQKNQAALYLAEITVFSDENHQEKISQAAELLANLEQNDSQNPDLARCRARILAGQGNFEQAADLWAKLAKTLEPNSARWWQAKFFEFDCAAKAEKISRKNLAHSIEVLQASTGSIPDFWAEKLKLLRQQCTADTNNS